MTNFSEHQKQLIDIMIATEANSLKDFHGENASGYDIFLKNHKITPEKEEKINTILKDAYDLNPDINNGFNKPELQKIKKHFSTNKRKFSFIQPPSSTHSMTTRNTRRKGRGKAKKKKKKNKKSKSKGK